MGDSTTLERVQERIETATRVALIRAAAQSANMDLVGNHMAVSLGDEPLEVRDRATGRTFMLEVRALPTGG